MLYAQSILAKVNDFDGILVRCISETIVGVVGVRVWDAICVHMLTRFSVTRDELPGHLENLQAVLKSAFGPMGAGTLSRAIARRLYSELNIEFAERPHFRLVDYVALARRIVDSSQSETITA